MKKSLILTLEYPPQMGGIATYVHGLAVTLGGDHVSVIAPPHKESVIWDEVQPYAVIRRHLLFPRWVWPRWLKIVLEVARINTKIHIDRLLVHHVLPIGTAAVLLKWLYHIPFLLFYHGTDVAVAISSPWKRRLVSFVAKRANAHVFDSVYLQNRFLAAFPEEKSRTVVAYPAPNDVFFTVPDVATADYTREHLALGGKKVMVSVGRLVDGKGFPKLMRLMPQLLEKMPNLVWVVAGDGPKFAELNALAQKLSLESAIRFVGPMSPDDLRSLYAVSDVFVLLTHPDEGREEGLGITFLEAAAAGLPIVAGRSGGIPEAVLDGETGIIVDTYNEAAVVQAILHLLTDRDLSKKMGLRGQARMAKEFQWGIYLDRLRPLIE